MPGLAADEKVARGFHQFRQQEEIILEERIGRHVPVFRGNAQHDFDAALGRRMCADVFYLLVEGRLGNFAFLDVFHQPANPSAQTDRLRLLFGFVPTGCESLCDLR